MPEIKLFVVDTGPLITLAAADSLDCLLCVERAQVVISDAVFYEATHDASKLGAADILVWVRSHHGRVSIVPTNTYVVFTAARLADPCIRSVNLGEQADVEVIEEPDRLRGEERAILLCEETAVLKRVTVRDTERIVELSTMDFLRVLEAEQRIQSADAVFERAFAAGRMPSRNERLAAHQTDVQATIAVLVRPRRDNSIDG